MRGDWPSRRPVFIDEFARLAPDLLTLQETVLTSDVDQVAEMFPDHDYHVAQQQSRELDGQGITTMSRWPIVDSFEVDLHVSERTHQFACTSLVCEIDGPPPFGRLWLVNHLPDWQLAHERERLIQGAVAARHIEQVVQDRPGHVIVAGDFDADPDSSSVRFWTGRQPVGDLSVCYRDAWTAANPDVPARDGHTFVPDNPNSADWHWPYRRIDYILVRCGEHGGPTLAVARCTRTFDQPDTSISDHYGLMAELTALS
jgi:endonuclease/exonuclease/phosphatase family metal-dependent hydrolase